MVLNRYSFKIREINSSFVIGNITFTFVVVVCGCGLVRFLVTTDLYSVQYSTTVHSRLTDG
jgi:hypothetical protein